MTFDPAEPCLVLVCKRPAPGHAKQRLAATLGQQAALQAAQALLACALEDLQQWPGPTAIAPDNPQHLGWSQTLIPHATCVAQGEGNLGERLNALDRTLRSAGQHRLMYIGSDCPALRQCDYLHVAALLQRFDTVLMPARDGGVVLMASSRPWPDLHDLPWSTERLGSSLAQLCRAAGYSVAVAGETFDIDHAEDLRELPEALRDDCRPARQALLATLERLGIRSDV